MWTVLRHVVDCHDHDSQSDFSLAVGHVLLVGIAVSYGVQWIELCRQKNSRGLSAFMLTTQCFNMISQCFNGYVSDFYERMDCCYRGDWGNNLCYDKNMGFAQLVAQVVFQFPIFCIFLCFLQDFTAKQRRMVYIMFTGICMYYVFLISFAAGITSNGSIYDDWARKFASVIGGGALLGTVLVWAPQIYTTYKLGRVGSLSIPMLILQAPGSFLFAYYAAGPQHESITVWMPFLAAGVQQLLLLWLCVVFKLRERRAAKAEVLDIEDSSINGTEGMEGEVVVSGDAGTSVQDDMKTGLLQSQPDSSYHSTD